MAPPSSANTTASSRNSNRMRRRGQPSAINKPTSGIRSCWAMLMMLKMPTAPISSEMMPSPPTASLMMESILSRLASMSCWEVRVKSSAPWRAISTRRIWAVISASACPAP
ncbi:hypothetical protein D3C87_1906560 [compost metagenome]